MAQGSEMRGEGNDWDELAARLDQENRHYCEEFELETFPPNGPADATDIAAVQEHLGIAFASDYADFLAYANGWPDFYCDDMSLFGTQDFWAGRHEQFMFDEVPECLRDEDIEPEYALVIAASKHSIDMILHISTKSPKLPGWFVEWGGTAEIQEIHESFAALLESLIKDLVRLNSNAGASGRILSPDDIAGQPGTGSIGFKFEFEQLVRLIGFLKAKRFYFILTESHRNERDIFRDFGFPYDRTQQPFRNGGHFYLFPRFEPYEEMGIIPIHNPHLGSSFYNVQKTEGGPYLEFGFNRPADTNAYHGSIKLRPSFWLKGNLVTRPSDELRAAFEDVRTFVRREMTGEQGG